MGRDPFFLGGGKIKVSKCTSLMLHFEGIPSKIVHFFVWGVGNSSGALFLFLSFKSWIFDSYSFKSRGPLAGRHFATEKPALFLNAHFER